MILDLDAALSADNRQQRIDRSVVKISTPWGADRQEIIGRRCLAIQYQLTTWWFWLEVLEAFLCLVGRHRSMVDVCFRHGVLWMVDGERC